MSKEEQKLKKSIAKQEQRKELEEENKKQLEEHDKTIQKLLEQAVYYADNLLKPKLNNEKKKQATKNQKKSGKASARKRKKDYSSEDDNQEEENNDVDYLQVQPANLKGKTLYDYQLVGLNWMISLQKNHINGILADDMGLGKTLQTVAILAYMEQFKGNKGPHLIVAPLTVLSNWEKEFATCLPSLRVVKLLARREDLLETCQEIIDDCPDVIITSYEGVQKAMNILKKINIEYFVIDEAHRAKNNESKFSVSIKKLTVQHKLLLTGTPLQNNLHELWSLLHFIMPELFDDSSAFDDYNYLINNSGFTEDEKEENNSKFIKSLHQILSPFMLRRAKADAIKLPSKKIVHVYTGLSALQVDLYQKILSKKPLITGDRMRYLNPLMQLRKVCCHPYLFPEIEDPSLPVLGEHIISASGKMVVLDKLLHKLKNDKVRPHQVIIFSQFKIQLDIIEDYCDYRDYTFSRIDGDIPLEDRDKQISEFIQEDSKTFLFLISTRAGGLGINLYTADTVILYDSDFNPQSDLQAIDRAHRIGQKNEVMVYRLISDSTVEEKIIERQQVKLKWDQHIIQKGRLVQQEKMNSKKISDKEQNKLLMFGAEKIFKSKDKTITDEDIDQLLKRGEERTLKEQEELDKQIEQQLSKIGDLSLDKMNIMEKISKINEADQNAIDQAQALTLQSINLGLGSSKNLSREQQLTKMLLQGHAEIITVYEHQLYEDYEIYEQLKQRKAYQIFYEKVLKQFNEEEIELPIIPEDIERKIFGLSDKEEKKLQKLEKTGFKRWTSTEFKNLVQALVKYDRKDIESIKKHIRTKETEEVEEYLDVFFKRLQQDYFHSSSKIKKQIETADKKRFETSTSENLISWKCEQYDDPLNEMVLHDYKHNSPYFSQYHDQWLIWANYKYGYRNWETILCDARQRFFFEPQVWVQETKYYTDRLSKLVKKLGQERDQDENKNKNQGRAQKIKPAKTLPPNYIYHQESEEEDNNQNQKQQNQPQKDKMSQSQVQLSAKKRVIKKVIDPGHQQRQNQSALEKFGFSAKSEKKVVIDIEDSSESHGLDKKKLRK